MMLVATETIEGTEEGETMIMLGATETIEGTEEGETRMMLVAMDRETRAALMNEGVWMVLPPERRPIVQVAELHVGNGIFQMAPASSSLMKEVT